MDAGKVVKFPTGYLCFIKQFSLVLISVCLAPTQFAETAGWAGRPSKASFLPCNRDQQFKYLHSNKLLIKINMINIQINFALESFLLEPNLETVSD